MRLISLFALSLLLWASAAAAGERFPPPDFDSGHVLPVTAAPAARGPLREYIDVAVLIGALAISSLLVLKWRSRRGVFLLGLFSLAYFGFYREGCVCAIGSLQNVALALFDPSYTVPVSVVVFFVAPLAFALFFGRAFCAAVCPHGAIQDLVLLRPLTVPAWLDYTLRTLAYAYLGAAVLFAATGSAFIICEYDPFIPIFRLTGTLNSLVLGGCFLVVGLFIGRPYCRYFCPYGVLLGLLSRLSKWKVTIAPETCTSCRLCEASCPFGAIREPTTEVMPTRQKTGRRTLVTMLVLLPVLIGIFGWAGGELSTPFSRMHAMVRLAERIWQEENDLVQDTTDASTAFRDTGRPIEDLYAEALTVRGWFVSGGWLFGGWIGLVSGVKLILLSRRRRRTDYEADPISCLACARCYEYCPYEHVCPETDR